MMRKNLDIRVSDERNDIEGYVEYTKLANQIIVSAVEDYRKACVLYTPRIKPGMTHLQCETLKQSARNINERRSATRRDVRRFISSGWYKILTSLPSTIIIKELDRLDAAAGI